MSLAETADISRIKVSQHRTALRLTSCSCSLGQSLRCYGTRG